MGISDALDWQCLCLLLRCHLLCVCASLCLCLYLMLVESLMFGWLSSHPPSAGAPVPQPIPVAQQPTPLAKQPPLIALPCTVVHLPLVAPLAFSGLSRILLSASSSLVKPVLFVWLLCASCPLAPPPLIMPMSPIAVPHPISWHLCHLLRSCLLLHICIL